jgi:hypothetical protein
MGTGGVNSQGVRIRPLRFAPTPSLTKPTASGGYVEIFLLQGFLALKSGLLGYLDAGRASGTVAVSLLISTNPGIFGRNAGAKWLPRNVSAAFCGTEAY